MKILLIQPAKAQKTIGGEDVFIYEPLALEYLASGVKEDHDVKILDMRIDKDLDSQMQEFKPDVVGITAYTVHVNTVTNLFSKIKTIDPDIFTVVGGHHATVAPEDFFTPHIDLVVMGEGVFVFKEIISRFLSKRPFDGIAGISYLKDKERVMNPPEPITDLDIFPFPAREFTEKYRKYYYSEWMRPLASIRTSKGCPNRCNFCALWKLTGGKYLKRKPEEGAGPLLSGCWMVNLKLSLSKISRSSFLNPNGIDPMSEILSEESFGPILPFFKCIPAMKACQEDCNISS
jgi:radical SAM superfamily enzyme YgiQ (UPF0313 family)